MLAIFQVPFTSFEIPKEILVVGLITGLSYSLLGMGLTLTYKSSRVINFAYGEMGALSAILVPVLVLVHGWSYWLALPAALLVGLAVGYVFERTIIRRLWNSPRLIVLVASIGAAQLISVITILLTQNSTELFRGEYPVPFHVSWSVGIMKLTSGHLLMLFVVPAMAGGLWAFFRFTKAGVASRAAAENPEAAAATGVPVKRISSTIWAIAGLLAGVSAILVGSTKPLTAASNIDLSSSLAASTGGGVLLLRALAASMIGGMTSLPLVFAGGVAIGLTEQIVRWNYPTGGTTELVLGAMVIIAMLVRKDLGRSTRGGEESSWSLQTQISAIDPRIAALPVVRIARLVGMFLLLGFALLFPLWLSTDDQVLAAAILLYALMALSLVVLLGFAGQLSLSQFTFVALGAYVGGRMLQLGWSQWGALLYAVGAGALAALIVGLPALRVRGLFLGATTLAFAVAANSWIPSQTWLVNVAGADSSLNIPRPTWLRTELRVYYLALAMLILGAIAVTLVRRSGAGRRIIAVRDNEPMAASLTVAPAATKLAAFVFSGALAAFAGYLFGLLLVTFRLAGLLDPRHSLTLVSAVIFGGTTTVTGAVLGAIWVRGIPNLAGENWGLFASGAGLTLVILFLPGGLASLLFRVRDRLIARFVPEARRVSIDDPELEGLRVPTIRLTPAPPREDDGDDVPIEARNVVVQFGGVQALDEVSVHARRGEIVGLIGPNGAGKTTLFDVLSGHTAPTSGTVFLHGEDVTALRPEKRAERGLGRSFQQARLFDELTVLEAVQVALERSEPSELVPSMLGLPPSIAAERRKDLRAWELVDLVGLGPFAGRKVSELSTGMRRINELACVVALGADVILLDEPTSGIAQREVEAFVPVLRQIRDHLDATAVVVAHDMPLMMALADRMYVLSSGALVAEGPPKVLRNDPTVIATYLGTDERTISRSGALETKSKTNGGGRPRRPQPLAGRP